MCMKKIAGTITIREHTRFDFSIKQNAENTAISLCQAGYYVRIVSSGTGYLLLAYTDRF